MKILNSSPLTLCGRIPNPAQSFQSALEKLSDKELFKKCRLYGAAARLWRQRFIGLLPEVNRRRLYEKKGFSSIFEFAAKLCGLSAEQVRLTLNLGKRFEDKPILKQMLESGETSINKLARVVSIVTPENEEELAAKVKVLPKSALETLVRDEKRIMAGTSGPNVIAPHSTADTFGSATAENINGLLKPLFEAKDLPGQALQFKIDDDITTELNELHSRGIDVNELLRKMLKQRRAEIAKKKEEITKTMQPARPNNGSENRACQCDLNRDEKLQHDIKTTTVSRYIPIKIKKILKEEYGDKCSIPTCQKPAQIIHHTQRFSLSQNHDPRFMAPLCREHHAIAHSIDLKYQQMRAVSILKPKIA